MPVRQNHTSFVQFQNFMTQLIQWIFMCHIWWIKKEEVVCNCPALSPINHTLVKHTPLLDIYIKVHLPWPAAHVLKWSHYDPSRSSKVVDFCTNRKRIYDFLFDLNCNIGPILSSEILQHLYAEVTFSAPTPISAKISGCSPWSRSVTFGLQRANTPG